MFILRSRLNRIKNLDCFSYGRYRIKVKIWKKQNFVNSKKSLLEKPEMTIPYLIPPKQEDLNMSSLDSPCEIDSHNQLFNTKTFLIHSSSQETIINEMCIFKFQNYVNNGEVNYEMSVSVWRFCGVPHPKDGKVIS